MDHHFNIEVATDYDMGCAVFINNVAHWILKNAANEVNFHEGKYWTYNSIPAFAKIFPYLNATQLKYIIKKCVLKGLVIKGSFNKAGYDKTNWYTLTPLAINYYPTLQKVLETHTGLDETILSHQAQLDETILSHRSDNFIPPIPDNKQQIINKDLNKALAALNTSPSSLAVLNETAKTLVTDNPHNIPHDLIEEWITTRKKKRAAITPKVWQLLNEELSKCNDPLQAFKDMVLGGWQSLKAEWVNKRGNGKQLDHNTMGWADNIEKDMF